MKALKLLFKRKLPSSFSLLEVLLSRSRLNTLDAHCKDRRELFQLSASALELSEAALMEVIANRIGYRFTTDFEGVQKLPDNPIFQDFLKRGALPVTKVFDNSSQPVVVGAYSIDPASLDDLLENQARKKVSLTSWGAITSWLTYEPDTVETPTHSEQAEVERVDSSAITIVRLIIQEARSYGASTFVLSLTPEEEHDSDAEPLYSFTTLDGRSAQGTINRESNSALRTFLVESAGGSPLYIQVDPTNQQGPEVTCQITAKSKDIFRVYFDEDGVSSFISLNDGENAYSHSSQPELKPSGQILMIEDDPSFSHIVDKYLQKIGYNVTKLASSSQVLAYLESRPTLPDLILCDVHMPDLNGRQVVELLTNNRYFSSIPIIALTSDERTETEIALVKSGAAVLLPKSKDPRVLCAHVDRLIKTRKTS